ncbi:MAG: hypothetical protein AB8C95_03420 [Phycisphaeraceae bacterium]
MVSTKATVQKVLDNLPDDCTLHEVMDRLAYVEMIQDRLGSLSDPDCETISQDEVERKVAHWLSQSDG